MEIARPCLHSRSRQKLVCSFWHILEIQPQSLYREGQYLSLLCYLHYTILFLNQPELPTEVSAMNKEEKKMLKEAIAIDEEMGLYWNIYLLNHTHCPLPTTAADVSIRYPVESGHKNVYKTLRTHHIIPMLAFDYYGKEIKPEDLSRVLKGTLLSVTYTLWYVFSIWNPITLWLFFFFGVDFPATTTSKARKDRPHDVNSFLANIIQVCVLKHASVTTPRCRRDPIVFRGAKNLWSEQTEAVRAFLLPKDITGTPSSSSKRQLNNATASKDESPACKIPKTEHLNRQVKSLIVTFWALKDLTWLTRLPIHRIYRLYISMTPNFPAQQQSQHTTVIWPWLMSSESFCTIYMSLNLFAKNRTM